ncbi:MAG: hypothetical protein WBE90_28735, partial [Xanthobacteraceae bacterium]
MNSFAAFGCGAPLKIAPLNGQIGSASTVVMCESTGMPCRFKPLVMSRMESKVTRFCPEPMLRCSPRWPW